MAASLSSSSSSALLSSSSPTLSPSISSSSSSSAPPVPLALRIYPASRFFANEVPLGSHHGYGEEYITVNMREDIPYYCQLSYQPITFPKNSALTVQEMGFYFGCHFLYKVINYEASHPGTLSYRQKVFLEINGARLNEMICEKQKTVISSATKVSAFCGFLGSSRQKDKPKALTWNLLPLELLNTKSRWQVDNSRMGRFLRQYYDNFGGHAIHSRNVAAVLQDGRICSSETLIREKGTTHSEHGILGAFGDTSFKIDAITTKLSPDELTQVEKIWRQRLATLEIAAKDLLSIEINFTKDGFETIARAHRIAEYDLARWCNLRFGRVEMQLSLVWKRCQREANEVEDTVKRQSYLNQCKTTIRELMTKALELEDYHNCTKFEISVLRNGVSTIYGNVAILLGNVRKFTSYIRHTIIGEAVLLTAWENEGVDFTINLRAENVLIVGPRDVLHPHSERYTNMVYTEDLTGEQREYLYPMPAIDHGGRDDAEEDDLNFISWKEIADLPLPEASEARKCCFE